jgi:N-methylhydantoinase A
MDEVVVGIDVGGTFTDFAVLEGGHLAVYKLPSTPDDPSRSILQGIEHLGAQGATFIHGSTVATNALLERKGARTALITTHGFEDVLEIGRQSRSELYNLMLERPPALVPRELRFGLKERVDHTATALRSPSPEDLEALARAIAEAGVEPVAVSLLFSFLNPLHEEMVQETLRRLGNKLFLSMSSRVLPEFREYERTSTLVVNAYVGPMMSRYLENLSRALGRNLRVMQSSGGSITASLAADQPVRTVLSGPAGGVVGAFYIGAMAGYDNIISLDMGGTSTDVSLCPGRIKETTSSNLGGSAISVPMIEIHSVGAGGGSIARLDEGGALVVGPQSAGADPGPACYGRGDQITVTDANLVLGRLQPEQFLGGRLPLDYQRAERLMGELAARIGINTQQAALGIIRVVNSSMERAIRAISLERGYDPREFTLLPFGGAGPMHTCELAQELRIPRILVPPYPGILSALGVAIADIVKDYSRTVMLRGPQISQELLDKEYGAMEEQARDDLGQEALSEEGMLAQRSLDVRYVGQSFELNVDYPARRRDLNRAIAGAFHRAHKRRFGYADPSEPLEIVNLRLKMVIPVGKPLPQPEAPSGESPRAAQVGAARVVFPKESVRTPLYMRDLLRCGNRLSGPALVLQMDSTTVIPPDWAAQVDPWKNLIVTPGGTENG